MPADMERTPRKEPLVPHSPCEVLAFFQLPSAAFSLVGSLRRLASFTSS